MDFEIKYIGDIDEKDFQPYGIYEYFHYYVVKGSLNELINKIEKLVFNDKLEEALSEIFRNVVVLEGYYSTYTQIIFIKPALGKYDIYVISSEKPIDLKTMLKTILIEILRKYYGWSVQNFEIYEKILLVKYGKT